jgi:hypothetical protein
VLRGLDRAVYESCDAVSTPAGLAGSLERLGFGRVPEEAIGERLEPLVARGLAVRQGARYLALAVPLGEYTPSPAAAERLYEIAKAMGRRNAGELIVPLDPPRSVTLNPARRTRFSGNTAGARGRRRAPRLSPARFSMNARGELVIRLVD